VLLLQPADVGGHRAGPRRDATVTAIGAGGGGGTGQALRIGHETADILLQVARLTSAPARIPHLVHPSLRRCRAGSRARRR
jgi:hypothetical protein